MVDREKIVEAEIEYSSFAGSRFIRQCMEKKGIRESVTWFELEEMLADVWIEAWLSAKVDEGLVHLA